MRSLEIQLNGAASGESFVIVSRVGAPLPATLTLRTTDGSEGDITLRAAAGNTATLSITPEAFHVSGDPVQVQLLAMSPSGAPNDTTVEVVQGDEVLAQFALTAVAEPRVRFAGRFQLRLATNTDPFDEKWGTGASGFRLYAVQGPNLLDPTQPTDEPELDRIIRFHDAIALRPHCRQPVEVTVTAIEAEVGGATVRFMAGDPLIGQPVRLGPDCKIEERDVFAVTGRAPIGDFRLEIGSCFSGASAPAAPPNQPPSNAPRAIGVIDLTEGIPPYNPSDFGYPENDWLERAFAVLARKRADLDSEVPAGPAAERIRTRRLQEHADSPAGVAGAMLFMQNYTGEMDRDLSFAADAVGALAYLSTLGEVQFSGDFLDFDSDCQCGSVTGTLGAKVMAPAFAAASLMPPGEGRVPLPKIADWRP